MDHAALPVSLRLRCLLAALAALPACGLTHHAPRSSALDGSARPAGEIAGVVYDSASGQTIQNAQLLLRRAQVDAPTVAADTTIIAWAMSDSVGRFAMRGIHSGRYVLLVRWIGYRVRLIPISLGTESWVELRVPLSLIPCPQRVLDC